MVIRMHKIIIDCSALSRDALHRVLAEKLAFPNWYGNNLDALYDCLTDLEEETHLILQNLQDDGFRLTVLEAALASASLTVTLE